MSEETRPNPRASNARIAEIIRANFTDERFLFGYLRTLLADDTFGASAGRAFVKLYDAEKAGRA